MTVEADLHVHTALSPCAEPEMTPRAIAETARERGLGMVAICDHNSALNVASVVAAAGAAPAVIAGLEITTVEEVHLLGLFPDVASALAVSRAIRWTLPFGSEATARHFGEQQILDAEGRVGGTEDRLLAAATSLPLRDAVRLVHRRGGLAVAAHVDRPSYSVFSQLGVFPEDAGFDAIELSPASARPPWAAAIDALPLPVLRSSDAHFLAELGAARSVLRLAAPTFDELRLALAGLDGREVG